MTPISTPSTVRKARNLWARMVRMAWWKFSNQTRRFSDAVMELLRYDSKDRARIGSSFAAFQAGYMPARIPTPPEMVMDMKM